MQSQVLNTVLQSLLDQCSLAYGNLLPVAYYFFYAFSAITLVKLGLSYAFDKNGNILSALLVQLLKMGFMLWVITELPYLHETLGDGALKLGIKAAGGQTTIDVMLNPSQIVEHSTIVIRPIQEWMQNIPWSLNNAGRHIANILFGFVAILFIIASFFYLAFQMFMALVDFYFTSVLAPVFLAFKMFEPTAWMGAGAIRGPIQHAVKLFTMAFIISMADSWIESLLEKQTFTDLSEVSSLVLASFILVALSLKAGTWASGMFGGNPTASAGDLVATAGGITGAGIAGAVMSKSIVQKGINAAATVGNGVIATGASTITGGQLANVTYSGNSKIGRAGATAFGATRGAIGMAMSTPKAVQQRIANSFQNSVASGLRQGYMSTGGGGAVQPPVNNTSGSNKYNNAAKSAAHKAQVYQRIAKAFKEHQEFNKN